MTAEMPPRVEAVEDAFGRGVHHCVGAVLARLEAHAVTRALTRRMARFPILHERQRLNNVIRGPEALLVRTT